MTKKQIGIGFIGLGAMGMTSARSALSLPQVGLVLGCDVNYERRFQSMQELRIHVEEDWHNIVFRDDIDLIYVSTPNDQHTDVACAAMEAGKCVLLQKPMAHNIHSCRKIMEIQKRTNAFLQIGFECRYSLVYSHIKEIIDNGKTGNIRNFHMDYFMGLWDVWLKHSGGWKWIKERSGGMVTEKLCHYIDLFQWYTGSIVEEVDVFGTEPVLPYFTINDSLHLGMRTENGAVGMISFSFCRASTTEINQADGQGEGWMLEHTLIGEKGSLYFHDDGILDMFLYERDNKIEPYLACQEDYRKHPRCELIHNTDAELKDVVRRVVSGDSPSLSPEIAYQVFEVCFAAEESIRLRRPVRLTDWRNRGLSKNVKN